MDRAEFDKFSGEYTEMRAAGLAPAGEAPAPSAGHKIRDIATAPGNPQVAGNTPHFGGSISTSVTFVRHYSPNSTLTSIEISKRCMRIARTGYEKRTSFISSIHKTIPFGKRVFDIAFANCAFAHIGRAVHVQRLPQARTHSFRSTQLPCGEYLCF